MTETVRFHCQQAAEKYLKAYLVFLGIPFTKTHKMGELITQCESRDSGISVLKGKAGKLTEYAVEVRYPENESEPTLEEAKESFEIAKEIKEFVLNKITVTKDLESDNLEGTSANENKTSKWRLLCGIGLPCIIVLIVVLGWYRPPLLGGSRGAWAVTLVLMFLCIVCAGKVVTGVWRGFLIDERNMVSLSRLQMTIWTIVILSGYFIAGLLSIKGGGDITIAIPRELWLLMGINTTSLIGSPLIKSSKKEKGFNEGEKKQTFGLLHKQGFKNSEKINIGQIVANKSFKEAQWSDLFKGEETANAAQLDLGKIQMLYFSLILVLVYAIALGSTFAGSDQSISAFPALDSSMVALLGISHAGYLINKTVPHSKSN